MEAVEAGRETVELFLGNAESEAVDGLTVESVEQADIEEGDTDDLCLWNKRKGWVILKWKIPSYSFLLDYFFKISMFFGN